MVCRAAKAGLAMDVFDVVRRSGRVRLDELYRRRQLDPSALLDEVKTLTDRGEVSVEGTLPTPDDFDQVARTASVGLTRKGICRAMVS